MKLIKSFTSRCSIVGELFSFLWQRRLWWLIPIVVMLVLLSVLLILGSSGVAPFIYTLF